MAIYKPLRTWLDEFIPYHMDIMGVDRPDSTHKLTPRSFSQRVYPEKNGGNWKTLVTKTPFLLGFFGNFSGANC